MIMRIRKQLHNENGFTLMELMVVVAIIGILVAIALPRFSKATSAATAARDKANVRTIVSAIETYAADHNGSYPNAAITNDTTATLIVPAYLKKWPAGAKYTPDSTTASEYKVEVGSASNEDL